MTDIYYIERLDNPGVPFPTRTDMPFPWHTTNQAEAKFMAYALNKVAGVTVYQMRVFHDTPPLGYLEVPFIPQWGVGANERRGDCGPACNVSIVSFLTDRTPTVNTMAEDCGQPESGSGSLYTNHAQLRKGATAYGVTLVSRSPALIPPLTWALLEEQVDAGLPSIALIDYGVLRKETDALPASYVKNQDRKYSGGHWVVFIGYDRKDVFIHDPNFWGTREQDGNARRVRHDAFEKALESASPGNTYGFQGLVVG